ncbi:MAG: UDP-N-acetylmuramoyl-tripeptide--D-alanyl-D-alanine ligase [Flavobacteriales bacterium]
MTISELYKIYEEFHVICTDSRNIKQNSIFFALKGENFNGNKFAQQAINDGCKYAIIDEEEYHDNNCILVHNVKSTLQELAEFHRSQINIPVIGITGTNGKTTTKELINDVLSSEYNCYSTKGNLNNQIGLPLSILEINESHEIAVIEMGASEIGEIRNLCRIAKPTSGLITNIGKAHLEGFGSFEGVIKAKTELSNFLKKNNGTQFVNGYDNLLIKKSDKKNRITYGKEPNSNFIAELISGFPFVSIKIKNTEIKSNLVGEFQYDNIVAASCIGNFYDISLKNIKETIESYIPRNNRTELIETKNNNIILDAYNANPSSMESMIESFIKLDKANKMCILGEMRELGSYSEKEHQKLINRMISSEIESIFVGEEFLSLTKKNTYLKTSELIDDITKYNLKNRTILIKGSRGIKLEDLVKHL